MDSESEINKFGATKSEVEQQKKHGAVVSEGRKNYIENKLEGEGVNPNQKKGINPEHLKSSLENWSSNKQSETNDK